MFLFPRILHDFPSTQLFYENNEKMPKTQSFSILRIESSLMFQMFTSLYVKTSQIYRKLEIVWQIFDCAIFSYTFYDLISMINRE